MACENKTVWKVTLMGMGSGTKFLFVSNSVNDDVDGGYGGMATWRKDLMVLSNKTLICGYYHGGF